MGVLALGWWLSAAAGGAVFHVSEPVRPGETVMVVGEGLPSGQAPVCRRLPDGPAGDPERAVAGPAARESAPGAQSFHFVLPAGEPGIWECAWRERVLLNRPTLWWAQGDAGQSATPGGWLRLFGKCLAGKGTVLLLKGPQTVRLSAEATTWAAMAMVPRTLPPGSYRLWLHAGCGGERGWSEPLTVQVTPAPVDRRPLFDATAFGVDGGDTRDDTGALQAALDKAGEQGGIVTLPRGRYTLSGMLTIPPGVTLRGASVDQVALCWPDAAPPEALLKGTHGFGVEHLTIYASRHRHIIVGDLGNVADAGHVRLHRVRIRADQYRGHLSAKEIDERFRATERAFGGDAIRLGGPNVTITDCDVYGSGRALYLSRVRGGRVTGNRFANGRWGWYCLSGSDGLIFENNTITGADLMSTGGGLNCLDGSTYSQHVWFARNRLSLMHGWDREAMTSDAGGGLYYGPVAKAEGALLGLPLAPKVGARDWAGAAAFILGGRGAGQYRRVVRVEGERVALDRGWDVPPDASSLVGITMLQRRYLLVANEFSDAGIAVQFYGCSVEHIVAANTCERTGGYQAIGKAYGGYQLPPEQNPCHQPSWYCQFLDNTVADGAVYRGGANNAVASGEAVIGVFGWPLKADWPWPYNVGAVVRRNRLAAHARIVVGGSQHAAPMTRAVLVENNVVRDSDVGIQLDRAAAGVVLRGNRFARVTQPLVGAGSAEMDAAQRLEIDREALRSVARLAGLADDPVSWPAVKAALAARGELLPAAWSELTLRRARLSLAASEPLLGLSVSVAGGELGNVLQSGAGGPAALKLELTARRLPAGAQVDVSAPSPAGWTIVAPSAQPLAAGQPSVAALAVTVPPGAWGRQELPVALRLTSGGRALALDTRVTVGTGRLSEWQVLGPLANRSGQVPDNALYAPDDWPDLAASLDGLRGKIGWQPARGRAELDLASLWAPAGQATGYALALVTAEAPTRAQVRWASGGGVTLSLNGGQVGASTGGADVGTASVELRAGDNLLLAKLSSAAPPWRFWAELLPAGGGVRPLPAPQMVGRPSLVPPPRLTTPQGLPAWAAGVDWRLVHADDFPGTALGGRWHAALGTFRAADGVLTATGDRCFLAYREKLAAPVRIEYDTRAVGPPGDLSAFWLRDPTDYAAGVLWGFGSNGNTKAKLLVEGAEVVAVDQPLVVPGRRHHVIAQALRDGRLQLIVDDRLVAEHRGAAPTEARHLGLWAWGNQAQFERVRIWAGP
jgi:hypothetical protein